VIPRLYQRKYLNVAPPARTGTRLDPVLDIYPDMGDAISGIVENLNQVLAVGDTADVVHPSNGVHGKRHDPGLSDITRMTE
jgi:hypothetical protein